MDVCSITGACSDSKAYTIAIAEGKADKNRQAATFFEVFPRTYVLQGIPVTLNPTTGECDIEIRSILRWEYGKETPPSSPPLKGRAARDFTNGVYEILNEIMEKEMVRYSSATMVPGSMWVVAGPEMVPYIDRLDEISREAGLL